MPAMRQRIGPHLERPQPPPPAHEKPPPFPGLHSPANLIHLCGSGTTGCHGWVHNHPKTAMEYGWIVSMGEDHPETVPVWDAHRGWLLLDNQGGYTLCDRDGNPR